MRPIFFKFLIKGPKNICIYKSNPKKKKKIDGL